MKILVIADSEEASLWDYYNRSRTEGVELILSCGDLKPEYLEFLATMVNVPVLFVRGNHDSVYDTRYPEGCIDIDDMIYEYKGFHILGLGGSMRYRQSKDMYTEAEMTKRINSVLIKNMFAESFDILVTHAPVRNYGDMEDLPHHGFVCFEKLLNTFKPSHMFYGHVHKEYGKFKRMIDHPSGTVLINGSGHYIIDVEKKSRDRIISSLFNSYKDNRRK